MTVSYITPRADSDTGVMSTWIGNASYFTGAHNLKAGVLLFAIKFLA
jgi:hypothetical protein